MAVKTRVRAKVTSKGQVTIPAQIRKQLGVAAGDHIAFVAEDGEIRVERASNWVSRTKGMFKHAASYPAPDAQALRRMAGDAIAAETEARSRR
jgi:AbrB family looped-hinge helix DNA binding protein